MVLARWRGHSSAALLDTDDDTDDGTDDDADDDTNDGTDDDTDDGGRGNLSRHEEAYWYTKIL